MTNPVTAVPNDDYSIIARAYFNPTAHNKAWWGATVKWKVKLSIPAAKGRTDCGVIQDSNNYPHHYSGIGFSIEKACETSVEAIQEAVRILKDMGVPILPAHKEYDTLPAPSWVKPVEYVYCNKLV